MKKTMICAALMAAMLTTATVAQAQSEVKKDKKECCQKKVDNQQVEKKECSKPADKQCPDCKKKAQKQQTDGSTAATPQAKTKGEAAKKNAKKTTEKQ